MIHHHTSDAHSDIHQYTQTRTKFRGIFIVGMIIVTVLGIWVRWQFIAHPMRYDESYNFFHFVIQSPTYIATHYMPNNHVLHTLMVKFVSYFLGTDPWTLRLPTFIAGVLLIPATALLGWTIFRCRLTAWVAAFTVCGASQLIEYSTNARGYIWLTLITTLMTLCTIYIIQYHHRRYLWFTWAALGIFGTYTLPIAACPIVGLLLTIVIFALRAPHGSDNRKHLIQAVGVCVGLWLTVSGLAYLPILLNQGIHKTLDTFNISYSVWSRDIPSGMQSLLYAITFWTREYSMLWRFLIFIGFALFATTAIRHRTPQYVAPLFMIMGSLMVVWVANAPLRPRAWMFALPIIIVCSIGGFRMIANELSSSRWIRSAAYVAMFSFTALASQALWSTCHKPYLASEPHALVDIEMIVKEYGQKCAPHSALLVRYTPATQYYFMKNNLPAPLPPQDPSVSQVMIVTEEIRPLEESWHQGVEGFNDYTPPKFVKQLHKCKLFIADRMIDQSIPNQAHRKVNNPKRVTVSDH